MNEKEYRERISNMKNKEIAEILSDEHLLTDIRKMFVDEAIKRFIEENR